MKALLFALTLFAANVFAQEIKIADMAVDSNAHRVGASFAINKEAGRAWVVVSVADPIDPLNVEAPAYARSERVKVEGLRFDAAASEVILERDGQAIVCATLKKSGAWIFKETYLKETGRCRFDSKIKTVKVDDGFDFVKQVRATVTLVVE